MSKSAKRVKAVLDAAGLNIEFVEMPDSTRTAEEAAIACKVEVGQIVKSLIFEGQRSGALKLLLVSGDHQVDLALAEKAVGEGLMRADVKRIRKETGFAIGGVSPIGHFSPLPTYIDEHLLDFDKVWAAAGGNNIVFEIDPKILLDITDAHTFKAILK
jgi:prolyl-tRNA editing enzyme YbaK/EbsC (Cys-tRNA(Pro) deacylase)